MKRMPRIENHFNGMIVVNKEPGYTSSDVVAKLRGILHMRKTGHTGTLDPEAVGVLPVCLGTGTKLAELIADRDKEYVALMRLGVTTDTQDMTGSILSEADEETVGRITEDAVREVLTEFTGEIDQIPPMYSAVWQDGKRLYELARAGKTVERKPRRVVIEKLSLEGFGLPYVTIRVVCSKGTYIRTLCEDIGNRLGCGAAMEHLTRTRVGMFTLEEALTLSEIEALMAEGNDAFLRHVIPVDAFFAEAPAVHVKEADMLYLRNGNPLSGENLEEGVLPRSERIRVYGHDGTFYALYRYHAGRRRILPVKMFHVTDSQINDPGCRNKARPE